jgi:hypothetical protein
MWQWQPWPAKRIAAIPSRLNPDKGQGLSISIHCGILGWFGFSHAPPYWRMTLATSNPPLRNVLPKNALKAAEHKCQRWAIWHVKYGQLRNP